jgi:hypothetical protein
MDDGNVLVFISYTHDSDSHKQRVLELSDRLRADGIDCEIDQYHQSPSEGWPKWMMRQVAGARFVIVGCTATYYERVTTADEPTTGCGSRWESLLITQELYESGGANTKFVPVVFDGADTKFRPPFLQGSTYYDLSAADGYERLYRHLTNQPTVVKPPLGKVRQFEQTQPQTETTPEELRSQGEPSPRNLQALVLIFPLELTSRPVTFEATRIEVGDQITIELHSNDSPTAEFFTRLDQNRSTKIGLAFHHTAVYASVLDAKQVVEAGVERWIVRLAPSHKEIQALVGEMAFGNYSADDIAELRARRLLLNETTSAQSTSQTVHVMNESMLEVLIRGLNSPVEAKESPFPQIYGLLKQEPRYFVAVAKLFALLMLHLSGTIERVSKLNLELEPNAQLAVDFEGVRPRRYQNVEPAVIRVAGHCDLTSVPSAVT